MKTKTLPLALVLATLIGPLASFADNVDLEETYVTVSRPKDNTHKLYIKLGENGRVKSFLENRGNDTGSMQFDIAKKCRVSFDVQKENVVFSFQCKDAKKKPVMTSLTIVDYAGLAKDNSLKAGLDVSLIGKVPQLNSKGFQDAESNYTGTFNLTVHDLSEVE